MINNVFLPSSVRIINYITRKRARGLRVGVDIEEEAELRHWRTKVSVNAHEAAAVGKHLGLLASDTGWHRGQSGEFTGIEEEDGGSESRSLKASDL